MAFSFIEIGDSSCSNHSFIISSISKIVLDNSVELDIEFCNKQDNIIHIKTTKYMNEFGDHLDLPLNYFYLSVYIDTTSTSQELLYGSSIIYGYNKDESYVDTLTQALITTDLYNKLKERFDIAFNGDELYLAIFLNHMFNSRETHEYINVSQKLKELLDLSYPLKQMCKPLSQIDLQTKYNWMIVRTYGSHNFLEEMLIAILEHNKQNVEYVYNETEKDLLKGPWVPLRIDKDIDIFIVITNDETQEYDVDENTYYYKTPDAFYQSSRRLLRQIPKVLEWVRTKDLPDRSIVTIKDVSKSTLGAFQQGCGTNCNCFGKDGKQSENGCCEPSTPAPTPDDISVLKESMNDSGLNGCCQGKESGCCKDPNATDDDTQMCGTGSCSGASYK